MLVEISSGSHFNLVFTACRFVFSQQTPSCLTSSYSAVFAITSVVVVGSIIIVASSFRVCAAALSTFDHSSKKAKLSSSWPDWRRATVRLADTRFLA